MYLWLMLLEQANKEKYPQKITQILGKVIGSVIIKGSLKKGMQQVAPISELLLFSYER